MKYKGMVIRPPSEAESFILQVTYGCSHNKCSFCPTYLNKPFQVREMDGILKDIKEVQIDMPYIRRVFLADGNAMVLSNEKLIPILDALNSGFPKLQRIGTYANADDILRKTNKELKDLVQKKLSMIYIGLESGNNKVLERIRKGTTVESMIEAVQKAQNAGFKVSVIGLLGLGGTELWEEHAIDTGKAITAMQPLYFSLLTLMIVKGTALYTEWKDKKFVLPEPVDMIKEMRLIIETVNVSSGCIFRTNHASNYLPLSGRFPNDKEKFLRDIDLVIKEGGESLKPEWGRGL
ncbi:MAG: radical SAM protein [bacterium]|nr:radical SAM protein [bacterium]